MPRQTTSCCRSLAACGWDPTAIGEVLGAAPFSAPGVLNTSDREVALALVECDLDHSLYKSLAGIWRGPDDQLSATVRR